MNLFNEKRSDLEEEKRHLNIGLSKIRETEEQVQELQTSLKQKGAELEQKREGRIICLFYNYILLLAANVKLKQMLSDQQKAEKEKTLSEQLQSDLAIQLKNIQTKKKQVGDDLAEVEPAVEDAKNAVKGIKKQQLVELRSMAQPPSAVKLALESVCLLLGENATDWKAIRGVMVKDDFITKILNFDT